MSEQRFPPTSGTDGNERVGIDQGGRPVEYGRRDLLRLSDAGLAGGTMLGSSRGGVARGRVTGVAPYRTIEVPPGVNR